MVNELDFDREFTSDEEVEEMLESLTTMVGEQIENYDNRTAIVNPLKIKAVLYTYKVMCYLTKGISAKVSYELNKPYKSMGSVSVVGKDLVFDKTEWFVAAIKLASNFNVYPKANGTIQMDFTFHGLTTPLQ